MECEAETKKSVKDVLAALRGAEGAGVGGKGHWVFREAFLSDEGVGLLLVITADEGFEQHFYLKVLPHHRGVTIKVDSVGHPYRTPAMRAALLKALAEAQNCGHKTTKTAQAPPFFHRTAALSHILRRAAGLRLYTARRSAVILFASTAAEGWH